MTATPFKDLARGVARLLFWFMLFSFFYDVPGRVGLALHVAFIVAFVVIHALPVSLGHRWDALRGQDQVALGFDRNVLWPTVVLAVVVIASRPWIWSFVSGFCYAPLKYATGIAAQSPPLDRSLFGTHGILLFLVGTLVFPLVEEFSFRGWLLTPLRRRYGTHLAVLVTAALFTIIHLRPSTITADFATGIFLGYTATVMNSIWPSVILHYAINLSLFVLSLAPAGVISSHWLGCPESKYIYLLASLTVAAVLILTKRHVAAISARSRNVDE